MTTLRQRKTNRLNARASTGPKTVAGKRISARNALRHGLNIPVALDPIYADEIDAFARRLIGEDTNPGRLERARRIAEAQIDLRRIRDYRQRLIAADFAATKTYSTEEYERFMKMVYRILRAGDPGPVRHYRLVRLLTEEPLVGAAKLAAILIDRSAELRTLERYERRAWSRRTSAIRAFDAFALAREDGQLH
jgi:enoyl-CoA hydratase/carnithine racemase